MAEMLGVSQQAVSKALSAAKITALLRAVDYSEALTWNRVRLI
jgi:predicted transcriptional regulator